MYVRRNGTVGANTTKELTDEDIYLMVCLHRYQRKSCEQIARQFGVSQGKVKDLIARRSNSGCCG